MVTVRGTGWTHQAYADGVEVEISQNYGNGQLTRLTSTKSGPPDASGVFSLQMTIPANAQPGLLSISPITGGPEIADALFTVTGPSGSDTQPLQPGSQGQPHTPEPTPSPTPTPTPVPTPTSTPAPQSTGDVGPQPSSINRYVALGDSYSSGQGNQPFTDESNILGTNECHRSTKDAYPEILKNDLNIADDHFAFAACSGAIMADFFKPVGEVGQWNEGPQLEAITPDTDLITLTLGGNDSRFAQVINDCIDGNPFPLGAGESLCLQEAWVPGAFGRSLLENGGKIIVHPSKDAVPGTTWDLCNNQCTQQSSAQILTVPNFSGLLGEIRQRAPHAKIRVLLYPLLFPEKLTDKCIVNHGVADLAFQTSVSAKSAILINQLADQLNTTIKDQVSQAKAMGIDVQFVDPNTEAFKPHRLCASPDPWINGAIYSQKVFSFHPTAAGQQYFADLIKSTL